jgi:hypothetical protein
MIAIIHDVLIIGAFVILGAWLESINGTRDFFDKLLTPIPLGFGGMVLALFERM